MWLKVLIICAIVLFVVCMFSIWYASTHFHKVYYRLSSDKISKPVKFAVLSDLHDRSYGIGNEKLLNAIEEEKPDALLVAGDMLTALEEREKIAEDLIAKLASNYRIFYGLGNHEAKMRWGQERFGDMYEKYTSDIKTAGASVLINEYQDMDEFPVRIYGLDIEKRYYKRFRQTPMETGYVESKLGKADAEYFNILLAHNPMYFSEYAKWKPDLVLSGHVHGGLVRLPFLGGVIAPNLHLFPKYDGGRFEEGDSTMILSRGLGIHSVEFRMWNRAELVVVELVPK
jgi:predicted MPP superfamily phosphohydrolase